MTGLRGARALVTGASSGLGERAALRLAAAGATVILHGRDAGRLADLAGRTGGVPLAGDLADPAEPERIAAAAGRVDLLVNNAGIGYAGPFAEMDQAAADALLAVNLAAPIRLTRLLLPPMVARGSGRVMFVTSIAGRLGVAGEAVYSAAKGGLEAFAESLRLELRGTGVRVGVFVPGLVDTAFFERRGVPYPRRGPRPIPADRAAGMLVRGMAEGRAETYAPRWLRLPVAVRAVLPAVYRELAGRFGA